VLTRPVGASFADYVAFPHSFGGLGVGHGQVALFLSFLIVIFVGYLTVTRKDVEEAHPPARSGHRRGAPSAAEYRSPYRDGSFDEERYPPRSGRPPYRDGSFDEERYPPRSGRPPYRDGSFDEERYPPRSGRPPYRGEPFDEEPYPPGPRDEEPRRPPEGFFAWDDR